MECEELSVIDKAGYPHRTLGIENAGFGGAQELRVTRHTRHVRDIEITITETTTDFSVPYRSAIVPLQFDGVPINYITLSPTVRGNDVVVTMGGVIRFVRLGSLVYPVGDYIVRSGVGTLTYRIPTMSQWRGELIIIPPAGFASPYSDICRVVYGYLPDSTERIVGVDT